MKATLDREGRIELPEEVRRQARLEIGMVLEVRFEGDRVTLIRVDEPRGGLVREDGVLVWQGQAEGEIGFHELRKQIQEERHDRVLGLKAE